MYPPKTLIAPLDWGLGHATRCVPLIQAELDQGATVHLASSGRALAFLRNTFPDLPCHELPDYDVHYSSNHLYWPMLRQLPKIAWAIHREQLRIRHLHQRHGFQRLLSDQRYGCYIPGAFNVFITHQLHLPLQHWPGGGIGQWIHETLIRSRFQECWVPDWAEYPGLAGDLSHPPFHHLPTRYIGPLSRLYALDAPTRYRAAFVLSGPEPQRSIWENQIREQIRQFPASRFFLVQGKPEVPFFEAQHDNLEFAPHLDTRALALLFAQSSLIVCRSGYSTLMDLAVTQRPAWLIPTPGQPEQYYLAKKMAQEGRFQWCEQSAFQLGVILQASD